MNETLRKFNYPDSLVHEYGHWAVLIRPKQVTLGCLILVEKSQATALGQVSPEAMAEFAQVCRDSEAVLSSAFQCDKFNYLALMMVDPNVHFHLVPRYAAPREFDGIGFKDTGWPKHPDMQFSHEMNPTQLETLRQFLATNWP